LGGRVGRTGRTRGTFSQESDTGGKLVRIERFDRRRPAGIETSAGAADRARPPAAGPRR